MRYISKSCPESSVLLSFMGASMTDWVCKSTVFLDYANFFWVKFYERSKPSWLFRPWIHKRGVLVRVVCDRRHLPPSYIIPTGPWRIGVSDVSSDACMNVFSFLFEDFFPALSIHLHCGIIQQDRLIIGMSLDQTILSDTPAILVKVLVDENFSSLVDVVSFVVLV